MKRARILPRFLVLFLSAAIALPASPAHALRTTEVAEQQNAGLEELKARLLESSEIDRQLRELFPPDPVEAGLEEDVDEITAGFLFLPERKELESLGDGQTLLPGQTMVFPFEDLFRVSVRVHREAQGAAPAQFGVGEVDIAGRMENRLMVYRESRADLGWVYVMSGIYDSPDDVLAPGHSRLDGGSLVSGPYWVHYDPAANKVTIVNKSSRQLNIVPLSAGLEEGGAGSAGLSRRRFLQGAAFGAAAAVLPAFSSEGAQAQQQPAQGLFDQIVGGLPITPMGTENINFITLMQVKDQPGVQRDKLRTLAEVVKKRFLELADAAEKEAEAWQKEHAALTAAGARVPPSVLGHAAVLSTGAEAKTRLAAVYKKQAERLGVITEAEKPIARAFALNESRKEWNAVVSSFAEAMAAFEQERAQASDTVVKDLRRLRVADEHLDRAKSRHASAIQQQKRWSLFQEVIPHLAALSQFVPSPIHGVWPSIDRAPEGILTLPAAGAGREVRDLYVKIIETRRVELDWEAAVLQRRGDRKITLYNRKQASITEREMGLNWQRQAELKRSEKGISEKGICALWQELLQGEPNAEAKVHQGIRDYRKKVISVAQQRIQDLTAFKKRLESLRARRVLNVDRQLEEAAEEAQELQQQIDFYQKLPDPAGQGQPRSGLEELTPEDRAQVEGFEAVIRDPAVTAFLNQMPEEAGTLLPGQKWQVVPFLDDGVRLGKPILDLNYADDGALSLEFGGQKFPVTTAVAWRKPIHLERDLRITRGAFTLPQFVQDALRVQLDQAPPGMKPFDVIQSAVVFLLSDEGRYTAVRSNNTVALLVRSNDRVPVGQAYVPAPIRMPGVGTIHPVLTCQINPFESGTRSAAILTGQDLRVWVGSLMTGQKQNIKRTIPKLILDKSSRATLYIPRNTDWLAFWNQEMPVLMSWFEERFLPMSKVSEQEWSGLVEEWENRLRPYFIVAPITGFERAPSAAGLEEDEIVRRNVERLLNGDLGELISMRTTVWFTAAGISIRGFAVIDEDGAIIECLGGKIGWRLLKSKYAGKRYVVAEFEGSLFTKRPSRLTLRGLQDRPYREQQQFTGQEKAALERVLKRTAEEVTRRWPITGMHAQVAIEDEPDPASPLARRLARLREVVPAVRPRNWAVDFLLGWRGRSEFLWAQPGIGLGRGYSAAVDLSDRLQGIPLYAQMRLGTGVSPEKLAHILSISSDELERAVTGQLNVIFMPKQSEDNPYASPRATSIEVYFRLNPLEKDGLGPLLTLACVVPSIDPFLALLATLMPDDVQIQQTAGLEEGGVSGAVLDRAPVAEEKALVAAVSRMLGASSLEVEFLLGAGKTVMEVDGIDQRVELFTANKGDYPSAQRSSTTLPVYLQKGVLPNEVAMAMVDRKWDVRPRDQVKQADLARLAKIVGGPPRAMFIVEPEEADFLIEQLGWNAPVVIVSVRRGVLSGADNPNAVLDYLLKVLDQAHELGILVHQQLEGTFTQDDWEVSVFVSTRA